MCCVLISDCHPFARFREASEKLAPLLLTSQITINDKHRQCPATSSSNVQRLPAASLLKRLSFSLSLHLLIKPKKIWQPTKPAKSKVKQLIVTKFSQQPSNAIVKNNRTDFKHSIVIAWRPFQSEIAQLIRLQISCV